jgi:hypothetical protein
MWFYSFVLRRAGPAVGDGKGDGKIFPNSRIRIKCQPPTDYKTTRVAGVLPQP